MMGFRLMLGSCLLVALISCNRTLPAQEAGQVLAYVGKQPITENDVDFQLGRQRFDGDGKPVPLPAISVARMNATIHLIALQRQALQTLRKQKRASSREAVERWLEENGQLPDGSKRKLVEIIKSQCAAYGISEVALREHVAFRLSWERYLDENLSQAAIESHFNSERNRFDGTRFQISQIAIAAPAGQSRQRARATEVLTQFSQKLADLQPIDWKKEASQMEFDPFVTQQAWVRGVGDVDPYVISMVLTLKSGQISKPIQTSTSVQLVQLHGIESGNRSFDDCKDDVRAHLLVKLLDGLAMQSQSVLELKSAE